MTTVNARQRAKMDETGCTENPLICCDLLQNSTTLGPSPKISQLALGPMKTYYCIASNVTIL